MYENRERRNVTIVTYSAEQYDGDFLPTTLIEMKRWVEKRLAEIPEEYRSIAEIDFDSTMNWDLPLATVEVRYNRPETDAEYRKRLDGYDLQRRNAEAAERAAYKRLKAKYER